MAQDPASDARNEGRAPLDDARLLRLLEVGRSLVAELDLDEVLTEVKRILKDDGQYLITVPWDFFMGPFFVLFNVNCLYQGWVKGSKYHRLRCGHINHFTRPRLRTLLAKNGLAVQHMHVVNGMSLYAVAKKAS